MDSLTIFLYVLIMSESDGIQWVSFNHWPDCQVWVDRRIDGYFGLQYADRGVIHWAINRGPMVRLEAPVAWWTWPQVWWNFGVRDKAEAPAGASADAAPRGWDHRFVTFRGPRAQRWVKNGLLPVPTAQPYVRIRRADLFAQTMDELFAQLAAPVRNGPRAEHLLESLWLQIADDRAAQQRQGPHEQGLLALAQQMRRNPLAAPDLPGAAAKLGLSYSHFRKLFKQIVGVPPARYQTQAQMELAARLLRETTLPIKEIAARAGVEDIYYFNRLFKRHHGLAPGRHRRQARLR